MKKIASKATKTPSKAKPTPVQVKTAVPMKSAAVVAPKAKKTVVSAPSESKSFAGAPAVKAPARESIASTTVVAQVDVGFGNQLFIRGEGAGLSWDKGVELENIAADRWQAVLQGATTPVVFKLLINDQVWSIGDDFVVAPGNTAVFSPLF
jgi:hypothetical protein